MNASAPPRLGVEVTCVNKGEEAVNVTDFLPWGLGMPEFCVEGPDGIIYDAFVAGNISVALESRLLGVGDQISRTYDLLSTWRKRNGEGPFPGLQVFSKAGSYDLTPTYTPFACDPNSDRREISAVSSVTFVLSPVFWNS